MTDAITTEIPDADIRELRSEAAKYRKRAQAAEKKNAELQSLLDSVAAERNELAQGIQLLGADYREQLSALEAANDPDSLKARVAELTGQLRERTHRDMFDATARDMGVLDNRQALDDLWHATGYTPETDDADPNVISELVGSALTARPWLKQAADAAPTTQPAPASNGQALDAQPRGFALPQRPVGPGAARGTPETTSPPATIETKVNERFSRSGRDPNNAYRI